MARRVTIPPRPRVIVTRHLPSRVEAELASHFDVELAVDDRPLGAEALQRALGRADGLLTTVTDKLTAEVFAANPLRTRIIANYGVGYDNIDTVAARARDVVVTNTPDVLTNSTADLAIMLMLMVMRRAGEGEREVRGREWSGWRPTHLMGREVTGKTLGVIGLGRIGTAVAQRAHHGFSMRVLCHTTTPRGDAELREAGVEACVPLDDLLAQSDVVSVHCPSTSQTRNLINAERLARMRPGAFFINTARGDIVVDEALIDSVRRGHLGGAGLDVFRGEPAVDPRYLELPNVVLLPHLGSATVETREAMGLRAIANLLGFFADGTPSDRVA